MRKPEGRRSHGATLSNFDPYILVMNCVHLGGRDKGMEGIRRDRKKGGERKEITKQRGASEHLWH